jgi:hypothetical protein
MPAFGIQAGQGIDPLIVVVPRLVRLAEDDLAVPVHVADVGGSQV